VLAVGTLEAQTQYYNLESLQPNRLEDAVTAERYSLDVQLGSLRVERLVGGVLRWRSEPRISYGLLPSTEIGVRAPLLLIQPRAAGANNTMGLAGLGIGGSHAFNLETTRVPALAIAAELLLPIGYLAASRTAYSVKGLATKTTRWGRVHLNLSAGTYGVRFSSAQAGDSACVLRIRFRLPGTCVRNGIPLVADIPCQVRQPEHPGLLRPQASCSVAEQVRTAEQAEEPRTYGSRWLAGLAFDHSFALQSTSVAGGIYAERFLGLYSLVDWTAEAGVRHQWRPQLLLNFGVASHFAGVVRSSAVSLGATWFLSLRRSAPHS
jgi:hypothetical protein